MTLCLIAATAASALRVADGSGPATKNNARPDRDQPASSQYLPALVEKSWQLNLRFQDPKRVSVFLPGRDEPVVYWYVCYRVENRTAAEVDFYPDFELVTDKLKVIRSEINVSPEAFRAVQRRSGDPLLITPEKAMGRLLQGEDRARHSVAIFRDFDPEVRSFNLYMSGLSGEAKRVKNPAFDRGNPETDDNPRYFTLRKTLEVPYKLPGSPATTAQATPVRLTDKQKWIMR